MLTTRRSTTFALALAGMVAAGCHPGVHTYDPCASGEHCDRGAERCLEIVFPGPTGEGVGSMCTEQGCTRDADCPTDVRGRTGVCLEFDAAASTCFESCTRVGDCAAGWSCQSVAPIAGGTADVCVPSAP